MDIKEFKPKPMINVPRWLETILQCCVFVIIIFFIHFFGFDKTIKDIDLFNFTSSNYVSVIILIILYYLYKLLGTHTATDLIEIDYDNKKVKFVYWLFYAYQKTLTIKFEEFSYKIKSDITILGGSLAIRIYQNKKLKIKLNRRNGWKDKQIDEITKDFLFIKPPSQPMTEKSY
jgi:hypothetical protein